MGKYWIFDGNDVMGPFSPQELVVREGFSSLSLICPESQSSEANDWQVASSFDEFVFDENGKLVEVKVAPSEEPNPETSPSLAEQNNANEDTLRDVLDGNVALDKKPFEAVEPFDTFRLKTQVEHVETNLSSTPEIETFLQEQQELALPNRKKAHLMLLIVFVLLIIGGAGVLSHYLTNLANKTRQTAEKAKAVAAMQQQKATSKKQEYVPTSPVVSVKPSTNQDPNLDKALSIAQHYWLPTKKSTLISYLSDSYKDHFSNGYVETWSAEPLHKNTYIVKYRLAKPRLEPIVYMFQVDVSTGTMTGALNNIAIDLIGKI